MQSIHVSLIIYFLLCNNCKCAILKQHYYTFIITSQCLISRHKLGWEGISMLNRRFKNMEFMEDYVGMGKG